MRPDALRPGYHQGCPTSLAKLKTRLSKGEKPNRKRIAEIGAVYELTPEPRKPERRARQQPGEDHARA